MERLGAERRSHTVDANHNEAEVSKRLVVASRRTETARRARTFLRSRIDEVHEWIFRCSIESRRLPKQAVHRRLSVPPHHSDRHRRLPSRSTQLRNVLLRQRHQHLAVIVAENCHLRCVSGRIHINERASIGRWCHRMIRILRCQQIHTLSVKTSAIEV